MGEHGHTSTVFKRAIERGNVVAASSRSAKLARSTSATRSSSSCSSRSATGHAHAECASGGSSGT